MEIRKKIIYGASYFLGLLINTSVWSYPVLNSMSGLAEQSMQLNSILMEKNQNFAQLKKLTEQRGAVLTLIGVAKLEKNGVNVIAHRHNAQSYQYERLKGLASPFFVLVQNSSGRPIAIEPYKMHLTVGGQTVAPITHRRMETLLTRTNMKKATLGEMISKVTTLATGAGMAFTATASGGGASLIKDSMLGVASGKNVEEVAFSMLDNPALKGVKMLAEKEMAEQFKEGDELFVQPEVIHLKPYEVITMNIFFENISLNENNVELGVSIDGMTNHRFQFIQPATTNVAGVL